MEKKLDLLTMGEILMRLTPPDMERLENCSRFEKQIGGSEFNVAAGAAMLGLDAGVFSRLPANALGGSVRRAVRGAGLSDKYLCDDDGPDARLGLYYLERGAAPRKPTIVYDRAASSMTRITADMLPQNACENIRMFHTSGITLALGGSARDAAFETARRCRAGGAQISFDVNYRANLWDENTARETIRAFLPLVDILFVSEESSRRMFRKTGTLAEIQKSYCDEYGVQIVATTQRTVHSPKQHDFTSTLYCAKTGLCYRQEPYRCIDVVDRVGSGDAYCAGVLYGLLRYGDCEQAMAYGDACASVRQHPARWNKRCPWDLTRSSFSPRS